jgi:hypothetical protein
MINEQQYEDKHDYYFKYNNWGCWQYCRQVTISTFEYIAYSDKSKNGQLELFSLQTFNDIYQARDKKPLTDEEFFELQLLRATRNL